MRPGRVARRSLWIVACLVLVLVIVLASCEWRLSSALTRIDGAFDGLDDRPAAATDGSVTLLMLGTDESADGPTLTWLDEAPPVVSVMLITISGGRDRVEVDWLPLRGSGLSEGQPSGSVAAVETWTGRRIDHLAVVEWEAFADLGHDNGTHQDMTGTTGRMMQQAFLREMLENTLHAEMRREPWTLYNALHTVAEGMAVDEGWSTLDMNRLVFSLRNLRSFEIFFGSLDEPVTKIGE